MKKLGLIHEGKSMKVYGTDDPERVVLEYKDDLTDNTGWHPFRKAAGSKQHQREEKGNNPPDLFHIRLSSCPYFSGNRSVLLYASPGLYHIAGEKRKRLKKRICAGTGIRVPGPEFFFWLFSPAAILAENSIV